MRREEFRRVAEHSQPFRIQKRAGQIPMRFDIGIEFRIGKFELFDARIGGVRAAALNGLAEMIPLFGLERTEKRILKSLEKAGVSL